MRCPTLIGISAFVFHQNQSLSPDTRRNSCTLLANCGCVGTKSSRSVDARCVSESPRTLSGSGLPLSQERTRRPRSVSFGTRLESVQSLTRVIRRDFPPTGACGKICGNPCNHAHFLWTPEERGKTPSRQGSSLQPRVPTFSPRSERSFGPSGRGYSLGLGHLGQELTSAPPGALTCLGGC